MELGKTLRKARVRNKLTLQSVADKIGSSPANISKIETGGILDPGFKLVASLANIYGLTLESLAYPKKIELTEVKIKKGLPFVGLEDIQQWLENDRPDKLCKRLFEPPFETSDYAYITKVQGSSMISKDSSEPSFRDGSYIIVDPHVEPSAGDLILISIPSLNTVTFKQIIVDSRIQYLRSLNSAYPLLKVEDNAKCLGVVTGSFDSFI